MAEEGEALPSEVTEARTEEKPADSGGTEEKPDEKGGEGGASEGGEKAEGGGGKEGDDVASEEVKEDGKEGEEGKQEGELKEKEEKEEKVEKKEEKEVEKEEEKEEETKEKTEEVAGKGDADSEVVSEDKAARDIQRMYRGKAGRDEAKRRRETRDKEKEKENGKGEEKGGEQIEEEVEERHKADVDEVGEGGDEDRAARDIQRVYRGKRARDDVRKRRAGKEKQEEGQSESGSAEGDGVGREKEDRAARDIQRVYKGKRARDDVKRMRQERANGGLTYAEMGNKVASARNSINEADRPSFSDEGQHRLKAIAKGLKDEDWKKRKQAMEGLVGYVRDGGDSNPGFLPWLKEQINAITSQLNDLRSSSSSSSAAAVGQLAQLMGSKQEFELVFADHLFPALLKQSVSTVKVVGEAATEAATLICQHTRYGRLFIALLPAVADKRNKMLRSNVAFLSSPSSALFFSPATSAETERALTMLTAVLNGWTKAELLNKSNEGQLSASLRPRLSDASPEVREKGREAAKAFLRHFPSRLSFLLDGLDRKQRSMFEKVVDSEGGLGEVEEEEKKSSVPPPPRRQPSKYTRPAAKKKAEADAEEEKQEEEGQAGSAVAEEESLNKLQEQLRRMRKAKASWEVARKKVEAELRDEREHNSELRALSEGLDKDLKFEKKARRSAIQAKKEIERKLVIAEETLSQIRVLDKERAERGEEKEGGEDGGEDDVRTAVRKAIARERKAMEARLEEEKAMWKQDIDNAHASAERAEERLADAERRAKAAEERAAQLEGMLAVEKEAHLSAAKEVEELKRIDRMLEGGGGKRRADRAWAEEGRRYSEADMGERVAEEDERPSSEPIDVEAEAERELEDALKKADARLHVLGRAKEGDEHDDSEEIVVENSWEGQGRWREGRNDEGVSDLRMFAREKDEAEVKAAKAEARLREAEREVDRLKEELRWRQETGERRIQQAETEVSTKLLSRTKVRNVVLKRRCAGRRTAVEDKGGRERARSCGGEDRRAYGRAEGEKEEGVPPARGGRNAEQADRRIAAAGAGKNAQLTGGARGRVRAEG